MDPMTDNNDKNVKQISHYGFIVPLNHKYPEKWKQTLRVRWREFFRMIPLALRYWYYYWQITRQGRMVLMDFLSPLNGQQIYGAPIGGLGAGTIGRGFKGEFCRYSLIPGIYQYDTVFTNQFIVTIRDTNGKTIYHQVLSPAPKGKYLSSWKWGFNGKNAKYTALYPRSWTEYNIIEVGIKLICRQISPIIPNNYKDSSLPCAAFIWEIINEDKVDLDVSITFTFQSGTGSSASSDEKWTEYFESKNKVMGVMIHQELKGMPCTYGIASKASVDVDISRMLVFNPFGDGRDLWESLERSGKLGIDRQEKSAPTKNHVACAVCAFVRVQSNKSREIEFSLVWDMPKIRFHNGLKEYLRYYTKYFYNDKQSVAPDLCYYTLMHYNAWESDIYNWQRPVLEDIDLPDWYKSALFNELYYVADGGTVWLRKDDNDQFSNTDPRNEYGRFAYLEGHEYRMYNTYDVHFYAAFALAQLWPNLQASVQYEIRDAIQFEDSSLRLILYEGIYCERKSKGFVPHDIGDPDEEAFKLINAYPIHDVARWKDLNSKYILSCYRDYCISGRKEFLQDVWSNIQEILSNSLKWDTDNDGLIENTGFPDQTYDTWIMEGPSAYCSSLWLAALRCAIEISKIIGDIKIGNKYSEVLEKGKVSFQEKLWNGRYYNFDSSKSDHRKCIMSDQLCGQLFLKACGFENEVFPENRVKSALKTIFENNVMKYKNGNQGAVNGFLPNGRVDTMTVQSEEMWTGVSYGLAALMIHEGMIEEGFRTAEGVYRTVWEKIGMAFETPEALYENDAYRSIGYMRPLAIWAIHQAWTLRKQKLTKSNDNINH
ncbi:non-lysosomal glucosylceramidase [Chelonus insularis]|uniref:non-lysosomal glucosylceramidase n=1 Tax=Chelonus insularis TaxID=460826 RepID=UPI00158D3F3D|nr:non-lysosomal glucosylceramidase [Chelonus insularis]XP_034935401.1 non-lysosomal glucosylceramidase [Chelonus insularis]XP_034935402.1 non-lysosomal glucosylceramidase [Chelonus insularis]XP_034935403.1 non-lysosomal glucosylceramidase [Chelonus insularis]XP_034935404.1 non-lysosomal glucosylceramidase [Chelonus insularis]